MPQIYVALDNKQVDHQDLVVEMEGVITNYLVSILIDLGSNLIYVAPQIVDKCKMKLVRHVKPCLAQLATGTKIKVTEVIPSFQFIMDGFPT
jgi:hypothetical protein